MDSRDAAPRDGSRLLDAPGFEPAHRPRIAVRLLRDGGARRHPPGGSQPAAAHLFSRGRVGGYRRAARGRRARARPAGRTREAQPLHRLDRNPIGPVALPRPFKDFLRRRAEATMDARELRDVRLESARQMRDAGELEEAAARFAECADWAEVAAIALSHAEQLLATSRHETLLRWIDALPAARREADPWLEYWRGQCLLRLDEPKAEACLDAAWRAFEARGDRLGMLLAAADVPRFISEQFSSYASLDRWVSRIAFVAKDARDYPSPGMELRALCGQIFASFWNEELGAAPRVAGGEDREPAARLLRPQPPARRGDDDPAHLLVAERTGRRRRADREEGRGPGYRGPGEPDHRRPLALRSHHRRDDARARRSVPRDTSIARRRSHAKRASARCCFLSPWRGWRLRPMPAIRRHCVAGSPSSSRCWTRRERSIAPAATSCVHGSR